MCHGLSLSFSASPHPLHFPSCLFHKYPILLRPASVCSSFHSVLASRYISHSGSYGFTSLRTLMYLFTFTFAASIRWITYSFPRLFLPRPVNTQFLPPMRRKYLFLIH